MSAVEVLRYDSVDTQRVPSALNTVKPKVISPREDSLIPFPSSLHSELCWSYNSFTPRDYVVQFTDEELISIDHAVASFKELRLPDIALVCPENFPLPAELGKKLRDVSTTLHNGRGFVVLRGLSLESHPEEDAVIAFCGISSYIGRERCTNDNGIAMDHLRDASRDEKPTGREGVELHPSKMMAPLKFHADRKFADILALYVKSKAATGGDQYLSSAWQVYNDMMKLCPDALRILAEDFPWPGVVNDQPETTYTPVLFQKDGRLFCQLVYRIFEGTNLLTSTQWKALDLLESFANENAIKLDVQVGDIQLVNNFALLHARRGWVDRPNRERHYYRLGLRDPENAWARPVKYEAIFDDHLKTPPEDQMIPVKDFDPYGLTSLGQGGHG
ncbi:hypothetical protein TOPH_07897 [Tolypocladium ophioglossoides CBS 100239]|uniref:TauD/TfdA-like domain-containing protein n=1 Tax=Tolypocladium ophioglossoides (strain CBS 100239) TaxID=1163406 RepID=A0A0L0N064_TOLOC|nr:hypothetical protein TOPH_07897 [Tolypocladium ophioglossoides CBS 100239]